VAWTGIGPALAACAEGQGLVAWGRCVGGALVDTTGRLPLDPPGPEGAVGRVEGSLVGGTLVVDRAEWSEVGPALPAAARVEAIRRRFELVARLRAELGARGYLEVDTPLLLEAAGTDPFIEPIPAELRPTWNPQLGERTLYLHTSPELELKRLLCLGFPAIFQVGHVFRQGDLSPWHEPEFCMAEWYRVGWSAAQLADELIEVCAQIMPLPEVHRLSVEQLCGVDLLDLQEGPALSRALGWPEEPFVHAFSRLWLERVEPRLVELGAVLVVDWPAALSMLARRRPEDPRVAERFELVVHGVELANGFGELTDPVEQRARFQADLAMRAVEGLPAAPMPERFLAALAAGIPPCAGVALGVDRLIALALGVEGVAPTLSSPIGCRSSS